MDKEFAGMWTNQNETECLRTHTRGSFRVLTAWICRCQQEGILGDYIFGLHYLNGKVFQNVDLQNQGCPTQAIVYPQIGTFGMPDLSEACMHNKKRAHFTGKYPKRETVVRQYDSIVLDKESR